MIGKLFLMLENYILISRQKYYLKIISIGDNSVIAGGCKIDCPNNIFIGKDTLINDETMLYASPNAKIVIGDHTMLSYRVCLRTATHIYQDMNTHIRQQGMLEKDIIIGSDVWIGYGVQILSGVTIGDGAVIGAGAVVTKDCEPYGVYAGVPARKIKERSENQWEVQ